MLTGYQKLNAIAMNVRTITGLNKRLVMMKKSKVYTYKCKWFRSGSDSFELSTGKLYSSYTKASKAMNEEVDRLQKYRARIVSYNVVEREIF